MRPTGPWNSVFFRSSVLCAVLGASGILGIPGSGAASGADQTYIEDFTSTAYRDPVATTAEWNTATGTLRLPAFTPAIVGSYDSPGSARQVVAEGDYLYLADYDQGLRVLDISDPSHPTYVAFAQPTGNVMDLAVAGNRLFAACSSGGVCSIDIDDPTQPIPYWPPYVTSSNAYAIEVVGDRAYVACYNAGLLVLDVSDPSNVSLLGSYSDLTYCYDVKVAGELAFVAGRSNYVYGLAILDVGDPSAISLVSHTPTTGSPFQLDVAGNHAYVSTLSQGVEIVDVTNPASPTIVGNVPALSSCYGVTLDGDRLYVADNLAGLRIFDLLDPANPTQLHVLDTPDVATSVTLRGDYAYVCDRNSGVQVCAVRSIFAPVAVGGFTGVPFASPAYDLSIGTMVADGHLLYAVEYRWGGTLIFQSYLEVFDISRPGAPVLLSESDLGYDEPERLIVDDNLAITSDVTTLRTYDLTDPHSISLRGSVSGIGEISTIARSGDVVYGTGTGGVISAFDISDPDHPALLAAYDLGYSWGADMAVSGDRLYVTFMFHRLLILDCSDPNALSTIGNWDSGGPRVLGLIVEGDRVYLSGDSLWVLDVTEPASPGVLGQVSGLRPGTIEKNGSLVYLLGTDQVNTIVTTVNVRDAMAPAVVDSAIYPRQSYGMMLEGQHLFLSPRDSTGENSPARLTTLQIASDVFRAGDNVGQSLQINDLAEEVPLVRLSSTQVDSVRWRVSSDGGANWDEISPDDNWHRISTPGADLRWQSVHAVTPATPYTNPTCSQLTLAWRYQAAQIESVVDVPDDQGGQVRLTLIAAAGDLPDEVVAPVTAYDIHRRVDDLALAKAVLGSETPIESGVEIGGRHFLVSTAENTAELPSGVWETVATVHARQEDRYTVLAPTLADSTASEVAYSTYVVTTHTTLPSLWYTSQPDSGWSVDNIAPGVPTSFLVAYGSGGNQLSWDPCPDPDFQFFRIYRGSTPDFEPATTLLAHETASSSWLDSPSEGGWDVYYRVSAVDHAGNEGPATAPGVVTDAPSDRIPTALALRSAHPNPFNPRTRLDYAVPAPGGAVRLEIFDAAGRRVRVLVDRQRDPGTYEVEWNGRDGRGHTLASGVYLARLSLGGESATRKLVLMK